MEKSEEQPAFEQTIFNAIAQGDLNEFKNILSQHKGSVDLFDENGMTALQHAAYKGNKDMVQLLLDRVCYILYVVNHPFDCVVIRHGKYFSLFFF